MTMPDGGAPPPDTPFKGMRALQSHLVVIAGTAIEYALIAALVAIIIISAASLTAQSLVDVFSRVATEL